MIRLLLFATARDAAGLSADQFAATSLDQLLAQATARYGDAFAGVLSRCRVWVNGDSATDPGMSLHPLDEVAIIPPIAGG